MSMRHVGPGLVTGVIFGAGLAVSDLINPARVLAFLDVSGAWDPSLAFVMAAALLPSALGYVALRHLARPIMAEKFCVPQTRVIDTRLIAGSMVFGIGWGLAGFCPGPAVAGLALGLWQPWLFTGAMLLGMMLHRIAAAPWKSSSPDVIRAGG